MNREPRTILLATDGTGASAGARAASAQLCRSARASLHLVHAWSPWTEAPEEAQQALAWGIAQTERDVIEDEYGCTVAGVHVPRGLRAAAILTTARSVVADLVVLGGRRLTLVRELFTYRVSRGVVGAAHLPVLVVPGDEGSWPPQHVVVGYDGSGESRRAAFLGAWVARHAGADVIVASVLAGAGEAFATEEQATFAASTCAAELREEGVLDVSTRVETSETVPAALRHIVESSGGHALLALGARGSGALGRGDHPSVSIALSQRARLPLLLVPPGILERVTPRPVAHAIAHS